MTSRAQIQEAAVVVAARLELDAAELARLLAKTRRGGWSSKLDHLAGVLAWARAPRDPRGRPALDEVLANVMRHCPRRAEAEAALTRAKLAGCAGGWRSQVRGSHGRRGGRRDGSGRKPRGGGPAGAVA